MTRHEQYLARQAAVLRATPDGLEGGEGDTAVLLPGFGGETAEFAFLAPMLARHHHVIALELPEGSFDELVARIRAALPAEPCTLIGFSFGAVLALAVASAPGSPVARLVLGSGWLAASARMRDAAGLLLRLRGTDPDALPALSRLALLGPSANEAVGTLGSAAAAAHLRAALTADVSGHAARVPSLVIAGESDALVPRENAEELYGSLDDARYARIEAGHALLAERPAEVLALIEGFLADRLLPGPVERLTV